jgi:hypothetical protein
MITEVLQWGHRLSTVETAVGDSLWLGWAALQWGHRLSTVETEVGNIALQHEFLWDILGFCPNNASLQWGHRLSTVETLGITHMR